MKILIRLPNWLGDVVMSTAFVKAVRQFYPDAVIDVIVKKELGGIAPLIPGVNTVHLFSKQDFKGIKGAYSFGKSLRTEKYDLFFNLPFSLSSTVMAWATGTQKRIGYAKEGGRFILTNSYKLPLNLHRVDEYIYLLEQFTGKAINNRQVKLNAGKTSSSKNRLILINFNSEADSRRMPLDKAISIVNLLTRTFADVNFGFIGSPKEAAFVNEIINGIENKDRVENFAGKTTLAELC